MRLIIFCDDKMLACVTFAGQSLEIPRNLLRWEAWKRFTRRHNISVFTRPTKLMSADGMRLEERAGWEIEEMGN